MAGPVACVSLLSTWIGFKLSVVEQQLTTMGVKEVCISKHFYTCLHLHLAYTQAQDVYKAKYNRLRKSHKNNTQDGLSVMVRATTFSFYPIFAIFFALLIAGTGRDFGPMLIAEEAARRLCNKRRRLASSTHLTSSSSTHLIGEDEGIATTRYASFFVCTQHK